MSMISFTATVVMLLSWSIEQGYGRLCSSRSVTDFPTTVGTQVLSGDLQLLVPAWKLNNNGYIFRWQAIVQGQVSSSAIEFQIFRPNSKMNGVYDLVYGNMYNRRQKQIGNRVNIKVNVNSPRIPINPRDIIGIRLRNNIPGADPNFGLLYSNSTTAGAGVDVYYWQGMGSQACTLSLSDPNAGVLRGITPLVSWSFCGLIYTNKIIRDLFAIKSNPLICSLSSGINTSSTSSSVTPNIPTELSPSAVTPLISHDQSAPSLSLFPTSSSTIAVPYSSSISSTPVTTTTPRISKESYIISLAAAGVAISMLLLTAVVCGFSLLVIVKRFAQQKRTAPPAVSIEPLQYYDKLSSVHQNKTIAPVIPVKPNIAYDAWSHASEMTQLNADLPGMQDQSMTSSPLSKSIDLSTFVVGSKEIRMPDNNCNIAPQDIVVEKNVAYNAASV